MASSELCTFSLSTLLTRNKIANSPTNVVGERILFFFSIIFPFSGHQIETRISILNWNNKIASHTLKLKIAIEGVCSFHKWNVIDSVLHVPGKINLMCYVAMWQFGNVWIVWSACRSCLEGPSIFAWSFKFLFLVHPHFVCDTTRRRPHRTKHKVLLTVWPVAKAQDDKVDVRTGALDVERW